MGFHLFGQIAFTVFLFIYIIKFDGVPKSTKSNLISIHTFLLLLMVIGSIDNPFGDLGFEPFHIRVLKLILSYVVFAGITEAVLRFSRYSNRPISSTENVETEEIKNEDK